MYRKERGLVYASIEKGYLDKVLVDILAACGISRSTLMFSDTELRINDVDQQQAILFDGKFPRANFLNYKCVEPINVSFNTKHVQRLMKNVKKKDTITTFIANLAEGETIPQKLGLSIRPAGGNKDQQNSNARTETISVAIQVENDKEIIQPLPEEE